MITRVDIRGGSNAPTTPARYMGHDWALTRRHRRSLPSPFRIRHGAHFVAVRGDSKAAVHAAHGHGFPVDAILCEDRTRNETSLLLTIANTAAALRLAHWMRDLPASRAADGTVIFIERTERNFIPLPPPKPKPKPRYAQTIVTIT